MATVRRLGRPSASRTSSIVWNRPHLSPIVPIVAALLAACVHVQQPHAAPGTDVPLRVMSYNIHAGDKSLDAIADAIRASAPDIAALQEVDVHWGERSHFDDQPRRLAEQLGMDVRFAEIYRLAGANGAPAREFGVALLTRYPIVAFHNDTLTRLSTQDPNPAPAPAPGLLEAELDVHGTRVRVFNTHLDYRVDPRVRSQQVSEMLTYIGTPTMPTLVFGDMNAGPDASEIAPLLERLQDAWPASAGPGLTYPADRPAKRIDYVLVSSHFRVASAEVPMTEASDHRPVVVNLVLAR